MKFWSWIPQNGRERALLLGNWWNWQHPLCKRWNYKLFQKYTWLKKKKNSEPSNQPMDSRNVNFSIKKSQIDTHMLGLAQKLTKLDIPLETSVAWDSGSGSQKMPCPAVPNPLLFTFLWDFQSSLDKSRENSSKMPKRQNSGNTSVKVAETPAGNQQR